MYKGPMDKENMGGGKIELGEGELVKHMRAMGKNGTTVIEQY